MKCKNCQAEFQGNYCPNCGRSAKVKKINNRYFFNEIGDILNLNRGFFYTTQKVLVSPGKNIRKYILEDRSKFTKPIVYLIIISLLFAIITKLLHIENDSFIGSMMVGWSDVTSEQDNTVSESTISVFNWIKSNYGYVNLIVMTCIALWVKIFFRKSNFNFYEVIILLCYVFGIIMLILSIIALIQGVIKIDLLEFAWIIHFSFMTWAVGQFFNPQKFKNYLKALLSYLFGFLTFGLILAIVIGIMEVLVK